MLPFCQFTFMTPFCHLKTTVRCNARACMIARTGHSSHLFRHSISIKLIMYKSHAVILGGFIFTFFLLIFPSLIFQHSKAFLLISKLTNGLRLHQFLGTKTTEATKSIKTDANRAC